MQMPPRDRMLRNVSAEAAGRVFYLATRLFIPPFVLSRVGLEAYGLYGAVFVLVSYVGMSAIGFSNAYVTYVARFSASRRFDELNRLLSSGFTLLSLSALACFPAFAFSWPYIANWIRVPSAMASEARFLAFVIVGVFLAYLALSVFRDALTGMQEIAAVQKAWAASVLVETALIFGLVGAGFGLRGLGIAFMARILFEVAAHVRLSRRLIPWLRVRFVKPDRESLRLLLGFGGIVQVNAMLAIFLNSVERVVAAPLLGLSAAALLDLGKRFPGIATSIPGAFASAVLPRAAELQARAGTEIEARQGLASLYLATTRAMNGVSGLLFAFLAFAAAPSLVFWLGHVPDGAVALTVLFAAGLHMHMLTGPGTAMLKASGRPGIEFHYTLANALALAAFVPLSRLVLGEWTVAGVAAACVAATMASSAWFLSRAHRVLDVRLREYWASLAPGLLPYLAGALVLAPAAGWAASGGRIHAAAALAGFGVLYVAGAAALLIALCATAREREDAGRILRRARLALAGNLTSLRGSVLSRSAVR
jgi:O-antigen/teichoic acid export membrane protein